MTNDDIQQAREAMQIYYCRFHGMTLEEKEELKQRIATDISQAAKN